MEQDQASFKKALEQLINGYSIENESDTPDFILAQYIRGCLDTWNVAIRKRDKWYGNNSLHERPELDKALESKEEKPVPEYLDIDDILEKTVDRFIVIDIVTNNIIGQSNDKVGAMDIGTCIKRDFTVIDRMLYTKETK